MAHVLILDRDDLFREQLELALNSEQSVTSEYSVTSTPMMREACLIVAQQAQDVAFVSAEEGAGAVHALCRFQPDLKVLLTIAADFHATVPPSLREEVVGIIPKANVLERAAMIVEQILLGRQLKHTNGPESERTTMPTGTAIAARLAMALEGETILGILLSKGASVVAHAGEISVQQATELAHSIHQSWPEAGENQALICFQSMQDDVAHRLLYSRPIGQDHVLTFAASPATLSGALRDKADRLAANLTIAYLPGTVGANSTIDVMTSLLADPVSIRPKDHRSYALVWRPITELPSVLHKPVRNALAAIARAVACELTYLDVRSDHVQVVIKCAPEQKSSFVAYHLKQGSELEIQEKFGIQIALWERGHLALETDSPIDQGEFAFFTEEAQSY